MQVHSLKNELSENAATETKRLLNVKEVAEITGLGVSTIWRNSKSGGFPAPIAICGCKRWRLVDINRIVEGGVVG